MIYVYSYAVVFILFLIAKNIVKEKALYYIVSFIPLLLVLFRGLNGTDTQSYIDIIGLIDNDINESVEAGFFWATKFFLLFTDDGLLITKLFALIMFYNFALFFGKTKERIYIYTLLVLPVFFYDMYMNGIRYGVAYSFALIAYDQKRLNHNISFLMLTALAVSFHVSSIILLALMFVSFLKYINLKAIVIVSAIISIFVVLFRDRILLKLMQYSTIESPGALSGLMPLIIFILTAGLIIISAKKQSVMFLLVALFVAELLSFMLSRFTYMGMRLQFVVLLVMFCKMPEYIILKIQSMWVLLFISVLCFAGRYRNMTDEAGNGPSPFLPYQYYWQVK